MQNRVKEVLEDSIHCRDSDVYLVYEIWSQEIIDNPRTPYLDQVLVNEIDMINIFKITVILLQRTFTSLVKAHDGRTRKARTNFGTPTSSQNRSAWTLGEKREKHERCDQIL